MTAHTFRFTIGDADCAVIADGSRPIDAAALQQRLPDAPPDAVAAAFQAVYAAYDSPRNWFNMLLVRLAGLTLLVDTGLGAASAPMGGGLFEGLAALDVAPETVDRLFITHFHGDHINGLLTPDGSPAFPNARLIANRAEWEGWHADAMRQRLGDNWASMMAPLLAVQDELELIEAGDTIAPGITSVAAYGHTPGHTGLRIDSGGQSLLHLVDSIHYLVQLGDVTWSPSFDYDTQVSPVTRRERLGEAADSGVLTMLYHFPFPGLGHFARDGAGFTWTPWSG